MKQLKSMKAQLKNSLRRIDRLIFNSFYERSPKILELECVDGCETLLDIGCGQHSPIHRFSQTLEYTLGVDVFEPAIEESKKLGIHSEYRIMDWNELEGEFSENSFDCVCALDVIEHLSKEDGLKLIDFMERIARNKVIISTPNGFLPQGVHYDNPFQVHLSGWGVDEMKYMGYRVIGIGGWKPLKGEVGKIKWFPRFLWSRISLLSQPIIAGRPSIAFAILCIKDLQ